MPNNNGKHPSIDPAIENGFDWLMKTIRENFNTLDPRVQRDVQKRDEIEQEAKRKRRELLEKARIE